MGMQTEAGDITVFTPNWPDVTQLQEEGLRPGATRIDLWELKLTP